MVAALVPLRQPDEVSRAGTRAVMRADTTAGVACAEAWGGAAAVARHFGPAVLTRPCAGVDAVHAAVALGHCGLGVLPLESSLEGMVNRSHDLLCAGGAKVVGELLHAVPSAVATGGWVRFAVIAPPAHPDDALADRLMLAVTLPQQTGSLLDMLEPLARRHLSIEHWCARPARVDGWHYRFHFTVAASAPGEGIRRALDEVGSRCSELKLLGCYRGIVRQTDPCPGPDGARPGPLVPSLLPSLEAARGATAG